jgi:hypothetical protein
LWTLPSHNPVVGTQIPPLDPLISINAFKVHQTQPLTSTFITGTTPRNWWK